MAEPLAALEKALLLLAEIPGSPRDLNDYIILATALHYDAVPAAFDSKLGRIASSLVWRFSWGREE